MPAPRPRSMFGQAPVDAALTEVLSSVGNDENDDLVRSLLVTALDMDDANIDRLELKIASQALVEMLDSWRVFSPARTQPKATAFGSARTKPGTPDYELAVEFGRLMAERGWMTITGAGPGIMTAAMEGAGREHSFGVNIVLPFEQRANDVIHGDPKLAEFKYFFTRKLAFMKESDAFALLPGGFGTLDEAFELLTLVQTGKSYPVPIVLLDPPGSTYWSGWLDFVRAELLDGGMISPHDLDIFIHTHDAAEAAEHICAFYACYHSLRYVGKRLVLRLRSPLDAAAIAALNEEFAEIVVDGSIEAIEATPAEVADGDHVDLPRIAWKFDQRSYATLVLLIHRINELSGRSGSDAPAELLHDVTPEPDLD
ncbi:MAG: TIGR00730 family Rossman fold protein [Actinomycetota bacterium]